MREFKRRENGCTLHPLTFQFHSSFWFDVIFRMPGNSKVHPVFRTTTVSHIPPCRMTELSNFVYITKLLFKVVFPIYFPISDVWRSALIFPLLFPDLGKTSSLFFSLVLLENYQFYWYFQRIKFWLWWFSLFYIFSYSITLFFISFSMLPFNFSFFFNFFWDRIEFLPLPPFKYCMNLRLYISLHALLWLHCKRFATLYL